MRKHHKKDGAVLPSSPPPDLCPPKGVLDTGRVLNMAVGTRPVSAASWRGRLAARNVSAVEAVERKESCRWPTYGEEGGAELRGLGLASALRGLCMCLTFIPVWDSGVDRPRFPRLVPECG